MDCSEIIVLETNFRKNIKLEDCNIIERYQRKFDFYKTKVDLEKINLHSKLYKDYRVNENLKLEIELVPKSCWLKNIRSFLIDSEWERIRFVTGGISDFKCEICGERGTKHPVECHEVWMYDDDKKTQTLLKFQSICPLCHQTKHLGLSKLRGNYERAFGRFVKINGISEDLAQKLIQDAFVQHKQRSRHEWKLNFSLLSYYGINPNTKV